MTEEEGAQYNFEELIKNLITLSSPAEKQKYIMGFGAIADEMAEDFDTRYTLAKQQYIDRSWLTNEQIHELDNLDKFMDDRSGNKNPDFWDDDNLQDHPDWQYIRAKSRDILKMLDKDDLDVEIERTTEQGKSDKGKPLVIERTFAKLVKKHSS